MTNGGAMSECDWLGLDRSGLNCKSFNADFEAIPHADVRVFVSEMRADFRSLPVHAR